MLNLGTERPLLVAALVEERWNPGSEMHRVCSQCFCDMSWAGSSVGWGVGHCLVTAGFSKRQPCAGTCLELPGTSRALLCFGRRGFPGSTWCDQEGATGLEWGLKCLVFWSLIALLTPRNHSREFVVPASCLLGLSTAKFVGFCDFDVIFMYFFECTLDNVRIFFLWLLKYSLTARNKPFPHCHLLMTVTLPWWIICLAGPVVKIYLVFACALNLNYWLDASHLKTRSEAALPSGLC